MGSVNRQTCGGGGGTGSAEMTDVIVNLVAGRTTIPHGLADDPSLVQVWDDINGDASEYKEIVPDITTDNTNIYIDSMIPYANAKVSYSN